jgi:hypothetical protein
MTQKQEKGLKKKRENEKNIAKIYFSITKSSTCTLPEATRNLTSYPPKGIP